MSDHTKITEFLDRMLLDDDTAIRYIEEYMAYKVKLREKHNKYYQAHKERLDEYNKQYKREQRRKNRTPVDVLPT